MLLKGFQYLAILPATAFLLYLSTVRATGEVTADPEVAVQNVFRQILNIRPPNEPSSTTGKVFTPPKHMLELYQKYTAGGGPKRTTGSTVRSILPTKGHHQQQHATSSSSSDLLIFNVTCIDQTEEVHLAQLHLHRRRLPRHQHNSHYSRRVLAPPYRIRLYQILQVRHAPGRTRSSPAGMQRERPTRARTMPLASVPVPQATRGGWHALDITPVLRELLLNGQGPAVELMLGVRFEAPKGRPISPEHFLRDPEDNNVTSNVASSAFLVVFSEDSPDNGLLDDGAENHLQTFRPHTHTMAEMLQTAGGNFLRGVASVPKHLKPISDTKINATNKTKEDDFYIESSNSSYKKETDAILRHKHSSKALKGNLSNLYEESNSVNVGNHQTETRDDSLHEQKKVVLKRRRINLKAKMHISENRFGSNKRSSKESTKKSYVAKNNEVELNDKLPPRRRLVRSILDNELPEEEPRPTKNVPRMSPGSLLQIRKNGSTTTNAKDDGNTIPLPSGESLTSHRRWRGGNRRRRGRGKKRGEHKKRSRKLPENWQHVEEDGDWRENDAELDQSSGAGGGVPTCRRHKLEVNFADIGWSHWIISPQTFEAHYCAGSCPYPLTKPSKRRRFYEETRKSNEGRALKPTNHATIQSLVHAIGKQPEVPAPCCVPDHLSPMTLLYMDDAGNVVLKNYPAMSVDTCGCR